MTPAAPTAAPYVNDNGDIRWNPRYGPYRYVFGYGGTRAWITTGATSDSPILYKSERRALRVAERFARRQRRRNWREMDAATVLQQRA